MVAKKKGGGNLSRSQVVTVRLDPKLKFALELAARKQRRTISSFIEWAVEDAITKVQITENINIADLMIQVWDVEDADRFVKLALNFPELLTYEEEKLWKVITDFKPFWQGEYGAEKYGGINEASADWANLRRYWEILQKIAAGEANTSALKEAPFAIE